MQILRPLSNRSAARKLIADLSKREFLFIIRLLYKDRYWHFYILSFYLFLHCLSCVCQLFIKDHDDDDDDDLDWSWSAQKSVREKFSSIATQFSSVCSANMYLGCPKVILYSKQAQGSAADSGTRQVTEAIKPAVGCHYLPPGPRLPPPAAKHHRPFGRYQIILLGDRGMRV